MTLVTRRSGHPILFNLQNGFEFFKMVTTASSANGELAVMPPAPSHSSMVHDSTPSVFLPVQKPSTGSSLPSVLAAPISHPSPASTPSSSSSEPSFNVAVNEPQYTVSSTSSLASKAAAAGPSRAQLPSQAIVLTPSPQTKYPTLEGLKLGNIILSSCPGKKVRLGGGKFPCLRIE